MRSKANEQYKADVSEANQAFANAVDMATSKREAAQNRAKNQWTYSRRWERREAEESK